MSDKNIAESFFGGLSSVIIDKAVKPEQEKRFVAEILRRHPDVAGHRDDLEEIVNRLMDAHPEYREVFLNELLDARSTATDVMQVAEAVLEYADKLPKLRVGIRSVLTRLGLPTAAGHLLLAVGLIDEFLTEGIVKSHQAAVTILGYKAWAYGVTAWAFGHTPLPEVPEADIQRLGYNVKEGMKQHLQKTAREMWPVTRDNAITAMLRGCADLKIHSTKMKERLKRYFDNDPQRMATAFYSVFLADKSEFNRDTIQSSEPNYPK